MIAGSIDWRVQDFQRLETTELYAILAARVAVFVVEQDCPYQDVDGLDAYGIHVSGWKSGNVSAYARILPPGRRFEAPSIGRVLTTMDARGTGAGRELMRRCIEETRARWPDHPIRISAQCYLERFYESLGFRVDSEPYREDGIPHVEMVLSVGFGSS